jgi:hypothetical protein
MVQQRLEEDKDEVPAPGAEAQKEEEAEREQEQEHKEEEQEDGVEEWRQEASSAQRLKTASHSGPLALPYT